MQIYAENAPKYVLQPGSNLTRWGSLFAPPGPLATVGEWGCLLLMGRGEGEEREVREERGLLIRAGERGLVLKGT